MMKRKVPTIRKIAWVSVIPQLIFGGLLFYIYYLLGFQEYVLFGTITYLICSVGLRYVIPRDHRAGLQKTYEKAFSAAIPYFEDSYRFFKKYEWLDKYRYLLLLSSSAMSYREMALCNIAFCYGQIGNMEAAKIYYKRVLVEFPDSGLAETSLRLLENIESKKNEG